MKAVSLMCYVKLSQAVSVTKAPISGKTFIEKLAFISLLQNIQNNIPSLLSIGGNVSGFLAQIEVLREIIMFSAKTKSTTVDEFSQTLN